MERRTATNDGISLNYAIEGSENAASVVLHHPLATNLTSWDALSAELTSKGYRVIRLDARGHGRSDAPPGPYTFEMLAGDVVAIMDHAGLGKAGYIGLSMGGMVGQYLGVLHADRFDCLSLVSTTSAVPAEAKPMWQDRIRQVREAGMPAAVPGALDRWVTAARRQSRPELVAHLTSMIEATPVDGYIGWCQAISDLSVTQRLSEIAIPTQVIVGADDPSTPPAAARIIHERIKGSQYVELPDVSHMLQLEDPDRFHAAVVPFLQRHCNAA